MDGVTLDSVEISGVKNSKKTESQGVLAPPGVDRGVKNRRHGFYFFGLVTAVTMCSSAGTIFL